MKKVFILDKERPTTEIGISNYTHVRVYHACRPTNISDYVKNGIHVFSKEKAYEIVKKTLLKCNIIEDVIKTTFEEAWESNIYHFNQIFVGISQENLMNNSGHYLVYGSEFICGIAAQLFCQDELKKIGVPTIFVCDVAISKIPSDILAYIENFWFYDKKWDGGISLKGNIDYSEIIDYIQPSEMFDPIGWRRYKYG